jgi:hypothetical protein
MKDENELGGIWKEAVVAESRQYRDICPKELRKTAKYVGYSVSRPTLEQIIIIINIIMALQPLLGLGRFFSFLILYTVGRTPWTGDQPAARPLLKQRTTQTQNKPTQYRHPCLEWDSKPRSQRSSERRQFTP